MRKLIIVTLFLVTGFKANAQFADAISPELFHVVSDREDYISGETLWFTCFIQNRNSNHLSKVAYTELISPYGFSVARKKLPVSGNLCRGNLELHDTLSTGYYTLISYTNYAKNLGYKTFGKKKILIYNPEKQQQEYKENSELSVKISLENNEIVGGLVCRIYYVAIPNTDFRIIANQVDTLEIAHNRNLNYIEFTPEIHNHYQLLATYKDQSRIINLPKVKPSGHVLNLILEQPDSIKIRVQNILEDSEFSPVLSLSIPNKAYNKKIHLNKRIQFVSVDKKMFPKGNSIISIINANRDTLWERNITYDKEAYVKDIEIEHLKSRYTRRTPVQIALKLDSDLKAHYANLCVSVKKWYADNQMEYPSSNIRALFDIEAQDSCMISYWENYGPVITGQLLDHNESPLPNAKIHLSYLDSIARIQTDRTDESGHFKFVVFSNDKLADLVLKADTESEVSFLIHNNYLNNYTSYKQSDQLFRDSTYISYLNKMYLNHRINKLYKQSYILEEDSVIITPRSTEWINNNFFEKADQSIDFSYYVLLDSIHEYFHEFFPNIVLRNVKGKRKFQIESKEGRVLDNQPAFFIDGALYDDPEVLFSVNPGQCSRIDVVLSDYMIYNKIYGGLICLYTNSYDLTNIIEPLNSTHFKYPLFDQTNEFGISPTMDNRPDFRNTLYWNGNIRINQQEIYKLDFLTGDDKSYYDIVISGMTNNGQFFKEIKTIEVY